MKRVSQCHLAVMAGLAAWLSASCDSPEKSPGTIGPSIEVIHQDTPLLPVNPGDSWRYQVRLWIPAGVTSPGAAEVDSSHQRSRTYLGKLSPAAGLPEVDCFEVVSPNAPVEREFVEIEEDRILLRGSLIMRPETTRPMWLEPAVPMVIANLKPGTELPEITTPGGGLARKTRVVAREQVKVAAGTYPCIRILMTGNDGEFELSRTLWFAPGTGIVREEKIRHLRGRMIFRETQELLETGNSRP